MAFELKAAVDVSVKFAVVIDEVPRIPPSTPADETVNAARVVDEVP